MKEGERIYYTGDCVNHPGYGVIVKVREPKEYSPRRYDVLMDDGREFPAIYESSFRPQSGCRFWLVNEYRAYRKQKTDNAAGIQKKGA